MLLWKLIMDRWHLTHEDISVCRLVLQVAEQTSAKVCPACLDAIADERLQWQSLNLELMMRLDSQFSPEPSTSAKDVDETS